MESEFCEVDFTTATDWESFNAHLEEIFYNWKLYQPPEENVLYNDGCFFCELGYWNINKDRIKFDGKEFSISYYHKLSSPNKEDAKNGTTTKTDPVINDKEVLSGDYLPMDINCLSRNLAQFGDTEKIAKLVRLYALKYFIVLTSEDQNAVTSESNVKLLLSSFCISAFNTRCFLPIFVQVFQSWQNCFLGIRVDEDGFRFDYQMIHLGKIPSKLNYFSGILDLFKSKISTSSTLNNVWASVKLSYSLSNFTNFVWPRFKRPLYLEDSDEPTQLSFALPFGAAKEPISEIRLHVTWPKVYENMVLDNENHSDFDPQNTSNWVIQVFEKRTHHLLGAHLLKSWQTCQSTAVISELISDLLKRRHFNDLNVPTSISLARIITGASGSISNNANETKRSKKFLTENTLVSLLYYLFPDADVNNTHPYLSKSSENGTEDAFMKGMKTCRVDDLPWRLSLIMCITVHTYGSHAAAQFWYEFIQELRYRWEKSLRILGVQKGSPNHKTSLINQKLQMLNCCILKKMKRENIDILSEDSDDKSCTVESDDDEFFDCQAEYKELKEDNFKVAKVSLWNQPEGRLRKFNNLKLIETGEYMYMPITQEMTPKTEDQLEDDALVLMKLGSDSQGSKLRARMMCASLYSDMESFKAANPGAILEDFIRWYSPRDWIESEELDRFGQKTGKLSNRMLLPGNMWKEVWDTSIPVPAFRQKCLFDDIEESEKVLHFFESCTSLDDVFSLLLPTLIHAALNILIKNETVSKIRRYSSILDEKINLLVQKSASMTRNELEMSQYKAVLDEISEIESIVTRYESVELKLFPGDLSDDEGERSMLMELVVGRKDLVVPKGPTSRLGRRIVFLFATENEDMAPSSHAFEKKKEEGSIVNATREFLHSTNDTMSHQCMDQWQTITFPPYQKEYILHLDAPLPSPSSRITSHSLTAHICKEEIFMAGYIGRDLIFV